MSGPCLCGDPYCQQCFPGSSPARGEPIAAYVQDPESGAWSWVDPSDGTPLEQDVDLDEAAISAIQYALGDGMADDLEPGDMAVYWDGETAWVDERPVPPQLCDACGTKIPTQRSLFAQAMSPTKCWACLDEQQRLQRDCPYRLDYVTQGWIQHLPAQMLRDPEHRPPDPMRREVTLCCWRREDGRWLWGIRTGGVTGYEHYYWDPAALPQDNEVYRRCGYWSFCTGTPGRWASLWVDASELDPYLTQLADHVQRVEGEQR